MFSIIVPSYNRQQEIVDLLGSLAQQTCFNFEVVIVDDCSLTPVNVEGNYPFAVKLIRNQTNMGAAQSRNIGAQAAGQPWLLFLDDDDRFMPQKCQRLAEALAQAPHANFVYHPAKCQMVNEGFSYVTQPYEDVNDLTLENILRANKIGGMPMIGIRKDFFSQVGGLSDQLRSLEDYDFLLKVVSAPGFQPLYIDEALTLCAFHTKRASVSTDNTNTQKAIDYITATYIQTEEQARNFALNSQYMLAYPQMMNLSRRAAGHYWAMFKLSKNIKMALISLIILISPKLALNLKRFF
ncbi:glycosyltransferase [Pasteurellaceae bacterium RH1A]|nr:glycosyltransferase [Pasteurellaceae bacterium RH1A]